jgi:hypothetical protein
MLFRKYSLSIVFCFLGIFMAKMMISAAPVYFSHLDKSLMNAVIMQLEAENNGDDSGKENIKFADHKLMFDTQYINYAIVFNALDTMIRFVTHAHRYFDPYHPSVPTPPPNLV